MTKMNNYITKRADLSLQIRIAKSASFMISTKDLAILVSQKQCHLILRESQHTKKLLHVFLIWDLQQPCQRQSSLPLNVKIEVHSVPVSPHIMNQVGYIFAFQV